MKALDGPPPAQPNPKHPLVYKSGEPDVAAAGACADFGGVGECEPYHQVDAPTGAREVLQRVKADPNVNCAIAVDAVSKHLGQGFRPVTATGRSDTLRTRTCDFVEQSHKLRVSVSVVDLAPPHLLLQRARAKKEVTVHGRPGTFASDVSAPYRNRNDDLYVALADDISLRVQFSFATGRGATSKTVVDPERAAVLQPLAIDILSKYFS